MNAIFAGDLIGRLVALEGFQRYSRFEFGRVTIVGSGHRFSFGFQAG